MAGPRSGALWPHEIGGLEGVPGLLTPEDPSPGWCAPDAAGPGAATAADPEQGQPDPEEDPG